MISHGIGIEDVVIANAVVTPMRIDNVENANHTLSMIVSIVIDIIYLGQIFLYNQQMVANHIFENVLVKNLDTIVLKWFS